MPDIPPVVGSPPPVSAPRPRRARNGVVDAVVEVIALIGSAVCITSQRYSFYWPIIGIGITIVCLLVGVSIAEAAGPQ